MQRSDAWCSTYEIIAALRHRWVVICLALLGVLVGTYLGLVPVPRSYEATAAILVEPRQAEGNAAMGGVVDGSRIASLVQLLRSRDTMAMVVDREGLAEIAEFGGQYDGLRAREEAIERLTADVVVLAAQGTALIYVRGRANSPDLARRITLAVAQAGMDRRVAMTVADIEQTSDWLGHEIADLRVRVARAEQAVAGFLQQQDVFLGADGRTLDEGRMADLAGQINDTRERVLLQEARVKLWRQWQAAGDPRLSTLLATTENEKLVEDYAALQSELAGLSSKFGPDHPTVRATRQRSAEVRAQLAAAVENTIRGAETEIAAGNALIVAAERDLAVAQSTVSSQFTQSPELEALRREATAQRTLLQDYLGRYEAALTIGRSGSILPDMRITTYPVAPLTPIAPRTGLILAAAGIVGAMAILMTLIIAAQSLPPAARTRRA